VGGDNLNAASTLADPLKEMSKNATICVWNRIKALCILSVVILLCFTKPNYVPNNEISKNRSYFLTFYYSAHVTNLVLCISSASFLQVVFAETRSLNKSYTATII
jgi:hypothetical protein